MPYRRPRGSEPETVVVDDCTGPFEADAGLHRLSRAALTQLGREVMLAGHLQDRVGIPTVMARHPDAARDVAIREWMASSPAYTRRMQSLLGFGGTGISTIFKGLQLDIGFAHQFMDVHYELQDEADGEFWLSSCGALRDVVPMGTDMTRMMCHDIEDPTFDATAVATNPRAQVRPVHRPPDVPPGGPHCHWTVRIRPEHAEVGPHPLLARVAASHLARLEHHCGPTGEPGGLDDYSGGFLPDFQLEDLSHRALQVVVPELSLQGHLLARAYCLAVEESWGVDEAVEAARAVWTGVAWLHAERLVPVLRVDPGTPAAIAEVLRLHHAFLLRDYQGLDVAMPAPDRVRLTLRPAPALDEGDAYTVAALLDLGADEILAAAVHGVNPRARVERLADPGDARAAWDVTLAPDAAPAPEPDPVGLVRLSNGATQVFVRRRPLRR